MHEMVSSTTAVHLPPPFRDKGLWVSCRAQWHPITQFNSLQTASPAMALLSYSGTPWGLHCSGYSVFVISNINHTLQLSFRGGGHSIQTKVLVLPDKYHQSIFYLSVTLFRPLRDAVILFPGLENTTGKTLPMLCFLWALHMVLLGGMTWGTSPALSVWAFSSYEGISELKGEQECLILDWHGFSI